MKCEQSERKQRIIDALYTLATNIGKEFTDEQLMLWISTINKRGYTAEQVEHACMIIIENYEYHCIPPYAVFKNAIDACTPRVDDRADAEAMWLDLLDKISSYGSYREPKLDPAVEMVVRSFGGWSAVCRWLMNEYPFRHDDFVERFQIYRDKVEPARIEMQSRQHPEFTLIEQRPQVLPDEMKNGGKKQ